MVIGLSLITGFPCPCSFGALWKQNMCWANVLFLQDPYVHSNKKRKSFFSNPKNTQTFTDSLFWWALANSRHWSLRSLHSGDECPWREEWTPDHRELKQLKNPFTCHCCHTGYCNVWELDNLGHVVKVKWSVRNSISVWPVKLRMGFWLPSDASGLSAAERL